MERRYNYEAFTPEDIDQGLMDDLLNYLLKHNKKSDRAYYDIHLTSDGYCSIVEWVSVPYNDEHYNGEFKFVDEDEYITKEIKNPSDGTIEYIPLEYYNDRIDELEKEYPNWKSYQKI